MASQGNSVVVLRNEKGDLFAIPQNIVEAGRVPADKKAEVEQFLQSEVSGYSFILGSFDPVNASQNAAINNPQSNRNVGVQSANTFGAGIFGGTLVSAPNQALTNVAANVSNNAIGQGR
jgi:hypothetical protein